MKRWERLRNWMASLQPRLIIETALRLAVATVVNTYFSQLIFTTNLMPILDEGFKSSRLANWTTFRADAERMPKMRRLWPPHATIEFSFVFTTTVYIFLKCFVVKRFTGEEKDGNLSAGPVRCTAIEIVQTLRSGLVIAVVLFLMLLPMQRLAEMHVFVIVLNLVHSVLLCQFVALIMFAFSARTEGIKVKVE